MSETIPPAPGAVPRSRGESTRGVEVQLPNPPMKRTSVDAGHSQLRAQQEAQRAIATGSLDAPAIEATASELPYEAVRTGQAGVETASILTEREEAKTVGATLAEQARRGDQVGPCPGSSVRSTNGVEEELKAAAETRDAAREEHKAALEVLKGGVAAPDGSHRPGTPIAPGTTRFKRSVRVAMILEKMPIAFAIAVEGAAVSANMRAYLRSDDSQWWLPLAIASITVLVLTLVPYQLGIMLDEAVHGKAVPRLQRISMVVSAVFWIAVGVALACIRVSVDQSEAIRSAVEEQQRAIESAQGLGLAAPDPAPIDPSAVFDPTLPTLFWITVFLGFGVALIGFEIAFHNPARLHELRMRAALAAAQRRWVELVDHTAILTGSVALQESVNESSLVMWDNEAAAVAAAAAWDISVYHEELGVAAGDPAVPLAVEQHKATQEARRAGKAGR